MKDCSKDIKEILNMLRKQKNNGFHTMEIAKKINMFPIQVEIALMELVECGAVECVIYRNKLYAHFKKAVQINGSSIELKQFKKVDIMYA